MADMGLSPLLRSLFGLEPDKVTRLKAPNAQAAPLHIPARDRAPIQRPLFQD